MEVHSRDCVRLLPHYKTVQGTCSKFNRAVTLGMIDDLAFSEPQKEQSLSA
jgi:hypothetical protein